MRADAEEYISGLILPAFRFGGARWRTAIFTRRPISLPFQRLDNGVMNCRTKLPNVLGRAIGPRPVGQQSHGQFAVGIDPQRCAGEAEMSECRGREEPAGRRFRS